MNRLSLFFHLSVWGSLLMMSLLTSRNAEAERFKEAIEFLREHTGVVLLKDETGMKQAAIVPEYQGRVMTTTAKGVDGISFGWINRALIASGERQPHIHAFGGEDRFWLGPEGGQFSIFFKDGDPFDFDHWQTPAVIDSVPYEMVRHTGTEAVFEHRASITNKSNTTFDIAIRRVIRLLSDERASALLGMDIPEGVDSVVYESDNTLTNAGDAPWKKETGLLSIWILGMYNPSPSVTVVIPFIEGSEEELGPVVNDAYFGKIAQDRLIIGNRVIYFKGDGKQRGKIGLSPQRAKPVLGSYDAENHALTLVQYSKPEGVSDYVNSMWERQNAPYAGDTVNSYNDGPPAPGKAPLGPFYELETSSPAAALSPGKAIQHIHRTYHFTGSEAELSRIAEKVLGVSVAEIQSAFSQ